MVAQVDTVKDRAKRFPVLVREGDAVAKIYRTPTRVRGLKYEAFTVCWSLGGARQRRQFSSLDAAQNFAAGVVRETAQGVVALAAFTAADRIAIEAALTALASIEGTGNAKPARLVELVQEHLTAVRALPAGVTLMEAVQFYAARHPAGGTTRTVADVAHEFIADRKAAGCSAVHLRDLEIRLGRFAKAFEMPLGAVTGPMLRDWLYGLKNLHTGAPAKPRSKENLLRAICALFNFARRSKYVSTELALEISDVPAPRAEPAEIAVFTVPEIRAMLEEAHPEEVAPLAIAAFAPVRLAELARLDWKDIRLGERVIVIEARKAKCAQRRLVPVTDNLAAWLLPRMKVSGLVNPEHAREEADAPGDKLGQMFQNIASRAKVRWRRNALRHSCISYRVAVLKDVPQVALESGNSPTMIFSNYRSLVSEAAAADWFNVYPPQPAGNILPLVVGGAA